MACWVSNYGKKGRGDPFPKFFCVKIEDFFYKGQILPFLTSLKVKKGRL